MMFADGACDAEIARNPHPPEGWRRDGIDFFVAPPPGEFLGQSPRGLSPNSPVVAS